MASPDIIGFLRVQVSVKKKKKKTVIIRDPFVLSFADFFI